MNNWYNKVAKVPTDVLRPGRIIYVNLYNYNFLRKYIGKFDLIYFDGIGLLILFKMLTGKSASRMSADNTSLMPILINNFENFIICGGLDIEVNNLCSNLLKNKNILYKLSGYDSSDKIVNSLNNFISKVENKLPIIVMLGLGSPKQEDIALKLRIENKNITVITVGGYISQHSVNPEYFPPIYDKLHLRALYRLFNEKGHWKRFPNLFFGAFKFIKDYFVLTIK